MFFKEIYNKITGQQTQMYLNVKNLYGDKIADWFYNRFANFELLYEPNVFGDLFSATLFENHLELLKIKKLMTLQDQWELGNIVESTTDMTTDSSGDSTQSYQGFNVEGDFSKNSSAGKTTGKTTATSSAINLTDEYNKLISFDYSTLLDKVYSKFVVLFVLCYN